MLNDNEIKFYKNKIAELEKENAILKTERDAAINDIKYLCNLNEEATVCDVCAVNDIEKCAMCEANRISGEDELRQNQFDYYWQWRGEKK